MATIGISGVGAPFSFATGAIVTATALPAGAASYQWSFLDKPDGSSATLVTPLAQVTTFTADIEGTYLLQVIIDSVDVGRAAAVVPYVLTQGPVSELIAPAAGETFEKNVTYGWARAIQDNTKQLAWVTNNTVTGSVVFRGTWNAFTNSPLLGSSGAGGVQGDYYVVGTAGTTLIDGVSDWKAGDWIINNGAIWQKVDNTDLHETVCLNAGADGVVTDTYLRVGGADFSDEAGITLPFACTLVALSLATAASETWTAEVHSGTPGAFALVAGAVVSAAAASSAYTNALSVAFVAGDRIAFYCNGSGVGRPQIMAVFRKD